MLGGGNSTILNRAKGTLRIVSQCPVVIKLKSVEIVRNSGVFAKVDISAAHIAALREKYGDYAFAARNPFKDWLDD